MGGCKNITVSGGGLRGDYIYSGSDDHGFRLWVSEERALDVVDLEARRRKLSGIQEINKVIFHY